MFDPSTLAWTDLSGMASGSLPAARCGHGFTSLDGRLYVFGGQGDVGELHSLACIVITQISFGLLANRGLGYWLIHLLVSIPLCCRFTNSAIQEGF